MAFTVYDAPSTAVQCLYTKVRNITAGSLFFGFLPPHGGWLGAFEQFAARGSIDGWISKHPTKNKRAGRSLDNALAGPSPVIAIVQTPAVHVQDQITEDVKVLAWNNNTSPAYPVLVDPCWGNFYSSMASTPLPTLY